VSKVEGEPPGDTALIVLDHPIPQDIVAPLPLAERVTKQFSMIAYRRDRPDALQRTDDCELIATIADWLGLTCPAVSGNSGAPLLEWYNSQWHVVAVFVAASNVGPVRSWAVVPSPSITTWIGSNSH